MALDVIKKFYSERRVRRAVQATLDIRVTAATDDRGNHWIILQVVWAGIDIAIVIGLDAVGVAVKLQIDPEAGIRENGVAEDGVVGGSGVMHPDSGEKGTTHRSAPAVEGDDVARVRVGAAYGIVMTVNGDPARGVAQRLCACDIGADYVTLDKVAGGVLSEDHTRVAIVAGDEITGRRPRSGCQPADYITRAAGIEIHASVGIRQGDCSCDICANEVSLHRVVRGATP